MWNNNCIQQIEVKIMLIIILTAWLIGVALILVFFKGATRKEKELENEELIRYIKRNIR